MFHYLRLGAPLALYLTLALASVAASAQPAGEVAAVRSAIARELTKGGNIKASDITVTNVKFEGAFATATVAVKNLDSPMVFAKKSGNTWTVIFVGSGMMPGDCKEMGFPANSQMCR